MNLVVGATGELGSAICRQLREQGKPVRGLVRASSNPDAVTELRSLGVDIALGDLKDTASLAAACRGVDTVISTATVIVSQQPDDSFVAVDDAGHRALIEAARANGVGHFIYMSVGGTVTIRSPLTDAKRAVEQYLVDSGISYTILRPAAFMETWLGPITGFDHANHKATILGTGEQRISYVSRDDVARFAAACVDNPRARNRFIEIGGPQPISPLAALRLFEQDAGASYEVQHIPIAALQAQYDGAEHPTQKTFAALMLALASDHVVPMAETAREFGVQLSSVKDFASRTAAHFA